MQDWILTIGIDKFTLTEREKEYYVSNVNKGAKYVQVRGMLLSTGFQTLVQKEALEGKWQCELGNWHNKNAECFCSSEYVFEENKAILKDSDQKLLKEELKRV